MQSNRTFPRKVDRERITIGSFLAHRFGLRIFAKDMFSKRVRKLLATTFLIFGRDDFLEKSSENVSNDIFSFLDFHEI